VAGLRISAEELYRSLDLREYIPRDTNTTLANKVFFDQVKVMYRLWR
jgi:hypothetical protein